MLTIPNTNNQTVVVFTASFPGVYQFVFTTLNSGGSWSLSKSSGDTPLLLPMTSYSDYSFSIYLGTGDKVKYRGPECGMSGVRLGDEF